MTTDEDAPVEASALPDNRQPPSLASPTVRLLAKRAASDNEPPSTPTKELRGTGSDAGASIRSFYNSAQWSADGTSILVGSSENTISSFVLPADLLQPKADNEARHLLPQASTKLPEPTQVIAGAPYFSLADPATQTFLVGCRDHPLQLYHAFPNDGHPTPLCTYKLVRAETEQFITPASLIWQAPGTHFVCGSTNRIDLFDMSRHGSDGPIQTVPTIPSRRHISKGGGVGMKGTVSALSASSPDSTGGSIVAAGTWTRWMGLYDLHRSDKVVANWSIAGADDEEFKKSFGGQGIVQTMWSPCGRYLVVNERNSTGLLVYDIRGNGKLLSVLSGRKAGSQQKLMCDVFQGDVYSGGGFEIWAGSQDGSVAVWEDVGLRNEIMEPSWDWKAHDSPIGSTILHSSGSVAATCSGGWEPPSDQDLEQTLGSDHNSACRSRILHESSLKIWSVSGSAEEA